VIFTQEIQGRNTVHVNTKARTIEDRRVYVDLYQTHWQDATTVNGAIDRYPAMA